jgi:hypothetical protein
MMERVETSEDTQHSTYFQTYGARAVFLFNSLVGLFFYLLAIRAVSGSLYRFDIAALWAFPVLTGAIVWKAYKRRQMTKTTADALLTLMGCIAIIGGFVVGHMVT